MSETTGNFSFHGESSENSVSIKLNYYFYYARVYGLCITWYPYIEANYVTPHEIE